MQTVQFFIAYRANFAVNTPEAPISINGKSVPRN